MAGITLAQAQAKLDEYLAAETAVLAGQSVAMDGRSLTRANLDLIQRGVEIWNKRVQALTQTGSGRGRSRSIHPGF